MRDIYIHNSGIIGTYVKKYRATGDFCYTIQIKTKDGSVFLCPWTRIHKTMRTTAKYKDYSFNKEGDIEVTFTVDSRSIESIVRLEQTHDIRH